MFLLLPSILDTQMDEVVDVDIYVTRSLDDILQRHVQLRLDNEHILPPPPHTGDNAVPKPTLGEPSATLTDGSTKSNKERKFKYMSERNQKIDASTISERIIDTIVELPARHILA